MTTLQIQYRILIIVMAVALIVNVRGRHWVTSLLALTSLVCLILGVMGVWGPL